MFLVFILIILYLELVWKTNGRNVRILLEVYNSIKFDYSNVIVEIARMELWMIMDTEHIHLNICVGLCVTVDIPLSQPDSQFLRSNYK